VGDEGFSRPGAIRSAGTKKTAVIAVFVAATFGLMALLSVPSRFLPPALHIPAPIKQALNPLEPFIPLPIPGSGRGPGGAVSQGLLGGGILESPLAPPVRSAPTAPPPAPGTGEKSPNVPLHVPSIDHRSAGGENQFLPEVGQEGRSRRAIHRHHRNLRRNRNQARRCHEQRQGHVAQGREVKSGAKPGHPHGRGEQGRRGGPVR
jgi:hypothetical protein